jgi:S2P endopeptidase
MLLIRIPAPVPVLVPPRVCRLAKRQIPGITVPLSHTFPLLLALLLSQVIHEAGHLVAAAL